MSTDTTDGKLQPGQRVREYEILRLIGKGGMAEVYAASQPSVHRQVALKIMLPDVARTAGFAERFEREARLLGRLEHPHILPIYDFGRDQGLNFIAMRLIDGGTLETLINQEGGLSLPQTRFLLERLADALDYAHQMGVIHRDLKPSNVLIDRRGQPYITDFGIAKAVYEEQGTRTLTDTGALLGTPAYMSPEQLKSEPVDSRSDNFTLGIIAFEMLTGHLPVKATTPHGYIHKYINEILPAQEQLEPLFGAAVAGVIQRALCREPDDRYQTAGAFSADFMQATTQTDGSDGDTSSETMPTRPPNLIFITPKPTPGLLDDTPTLRDTPLDTPRPEKIQPAVRLTPPKAMSIEPKRPTPAPVKAAARPSQPGVVKKKFRLAVDAQPRLPTLCPVCAKPARRQVAVRYHYGLRGLAVWFCDDHAADYWALGLPYFAAHAAFVAAAVIAFMALRWPGLALVVVAWVIAFDFLNGLRSARAKQARAGLRLQIVQGQLEIRVSRSAYAQAFEELNRSIIGR